MDTHETMVVFRTFKHNFARKENKGGYVNRPHRGTVVALFPCDEEQGVCASYEHIGQHGSADYGAVIELTHPATPDEMKTLGDELESLGYRLEPRRRAPCASYRRKWLAMGNR